MSKGIFLTLGLILIVTVGAATGFFLFSKKGEGMPGALSVVDKNNEVAEIEKDSYSDSSGFSFSFPKGLQVSDITPGDYYSFLEIKDGTKSEKISLTVKDTASAGVDKFLEQNSAFPNPKVVGATTFGGMAAKLIEFNRGGKKLLATLAVAENILYLIEGPKDGSFWEEAQNMIAISFSIGERASNSSNHGQSASDVISEGEEEVVE